MANGGVAARLVYVRLEAALAAPYMRGDIVTVRMVSRMVTEAVGLNRFLEETITATDEVSIAVGKALQDDITATDGAPVLAFGKVLADTITSNDTAIRFDVAKPLADTITASETIAKGVSKPLADAITAADLGGTILRQSYAADPFYFADDYTGTRSTF